jgi:hypothetical protein
MKTHPELEAERRAIEAEIAEMLATVPISGGRVARAEALGTLYTALDVNLLADAKLWGKNPGGAGVLDIIATARRYARSQAEQWRIAAGVWRDIEEAHPGVSAG